MLDVAQVTDLAAVTLASQVGMSCKMGQGGPPTTYCRSWNVTKLLGSSPWVGEQSGVD